LSIVCVEIAGIAFLLAFYCTNYGSSILYLILAIIGMLLVDFSRFFGALINNINFKSSAA